jgi:hypothetical protein
MAEIQQPNIVGNFLAAYSSGLERQQQQQDAAYQRQRQAKADQMQGEEFQWKMDDRQIAAARQRADRIAAVAQMSDTPEKWAVNVPAVMQELGIDGPAPDFATREAKIAEALGLKDMLDLQFKNREAARQDRVANANIAQSLAAARASDRANQPQAAPTVKLPPTAIQTQDGKTLQSIGTEASAAAKIAATLKQAESAIKGNYTGPSFGLQRNIAGVMSQVPLIPWASRGVAQAFGYDKAGDDRYQDTINAYDRIDQAAKVSGIEALKGIGGSDTERELLTAIQTGVTPDLLPEENQRRMRSQIRAAEILGDKEEMAAQYLQTYGTLAPQSLPQGTPSFQSVWRKYQRQQWNEHLKNEGRIEEEQARRRREGQNKPAPVEAKKPIITRVK